MTAAVKPAKGTSFLYKKDGITKDITSLVLSTINENDSDTAAFAKQFSRSIEGLQAIWQYVKRNFTYKEDPEGYQFVQTPARLWHGGELPESLKGKIPSNWFRNGKTGDCKSFTVFMCSLFENMKIDYIVRFVSFDNRSIPTHVYPIAVLNGKQIIMDAVWHRWNEEKAFTHKKDYVMSEIHKLEGVGLARNEEPTAAWQNDILRIMANVPDSVLRDDITALTSGELARKNAIARVKMVEETADVSTKQMLVGYRVRLANGEPTGKNDFIDEFLQQAANSDEFALQASWIVFNDRVAVSGISDFLKTQWQKFMNWLLKDALQKAAPFFLHLFVYSPHGIVAIKAEKQREIVEWLSKTTGVSMDVLLDTIRTGITKKYGKEPTVYIEMLRGKGNGKVGAFVVDDILVLLPMVIDIIKKAVALFKKSDAPVITADAGSKVEEIRNLPPIATKEIEIPPVPITPNEPADEPQTGKKDNNMGLIVIIGVMLYAFSSKE